MRGKGFIPAASRIFMEDIAKQPKFSLELKQTARGAWYVGSFRVNADSLQELDVLTAQGAAQIGQRLLSLNTPSALGNKPHGHASEQEKASKQETPPLPLTPEEEKLFQNLKELRLVLAKQEGVPPYVVFHDSTLRRIVIEKPVSVEQLLAVIGEKKLAKYGELIFELLERHGENAEAVNEGVVS